MGCLFGLVAVGIFAFQNRQYDLGGFFRCQLEIVPTLHFTADGRKQEVQNKAELPFVDGVLFQTVEAILLGVFALQFVAAFMEEAAEYLPAARHALGLIERGKHREEQRNPDAVKQAFVRQRILDFAGGEFLGFQIFGDGVFVQAREIELFNAVFGAVDFGFIGAAGEHDAHIRTFGEQIVDFLDNKGTNGL